MLAVLMTEVSQSRHLIGKAERTLRASDDVSEGKGVTMGLFGAYLAYRHGKKKAERRAEMEEIREERRRRRAGIPADDDICDDCGYPFSKHSDDDPPLCPTY
jgi:rubrerythrin